MRDHGDGIAAADIPKLFRKFQQIDSGSTRKVGGTGLGLVISKGIVEQHGGRIGVDSTPGKAAAFWFTLPAAADSAQGEARGVAETERGSASGRSRAGRPLFRVCRQRLRLHAPHRPDPAVRARVTSRATRAGRARSSSPPLPNPS